MQAVPQPIDIDARLSEKFGDAPRKEPKTVPIKLFGEEFRVVQDVNAWDMLQLVNPDTTVQAVAAIFTHIIHEDDVARFSSVMGRQRGMNDEEMMLIFTAVVEAAASGHPTDSSSGSRRTTQKKAAAKRSVVRSAAKG